MAKPSRPSTPEHSAPPAAPPPMPVIEPAPTRAARRRVPSTAKLVHDLQVHQVELEMQNEELRRTQLELAAARDRFVDLFDFAPVGYFTLDSDGGVVEANLTGAHLLGEERKALLGCRFARFVTSPDASRWLGHLLQALHSDAAQRLDLTLRRRNGDVFHGQLDCLRASASGAAPRLRVSLTDVTQRNLAETDRRIADSVVEASEAERRRVARELHEELGQRLSALKMDLASLRTAAAPSGQDGRIVSMLETLDEAVASVRRIATDLRPPMLDDLGLNAAIDWLVRDTARRTSLEIALHLDDTDPPLGERTSIAVYRMVQETLEEIGRLQEGSDVRIAMRRHAGELVLTIEISGAGWPDPAGSDERHDATTGVRDRARVLGGRLELADAREGGRRITVRLPLLPVVDDNSPSA